MKLYTFEKDSLDSQEITQDFIDSLKTKMYQVVQWDRDWVLFKWNGEKYKMMEKSNKRKTFEKYELEIQYV